jgi:hypothetical protein
MKNFDILWLTLLLLFVSQSQNLCLEYNKTGIACPSSVSGTVILSTEFCSNIFSVFPAFLPDGRIEFSLVPGSLSVLVI